MPLFCLLVEVVDFYRETFDLVLVDEPHLINKSREDKIDNCIGKDVLLGVVYLSIYYHNLQQLLALFQLLLIG